MLGAGSMARAILAGLLAPHVSVDGQVRVTNRSAENATRFDTEPRVQAWATANDPEANSKAVAGAQIVLVAVKPAMVPDLLDEISPALAEGGIYAATGKIAVGGYDTVSYSKVLADNLKVMDASAVSMCRDNDIPIIVFNIREPGALLAVLNGEGISTTVTGDANG